MKKIVAAFLLFCLCGSLFALSPTDPLWRKAVEAAARNKDWVPGTVTILADVMDSRGKLTDRSWTVMRLSPGPDGQPVTTIVQSIKNGSLCDGPAGGGYLRRMSVSGEGSLLFITRSMTSTISLDGYWKTSAK